MIDPVVASGVMQPLNVWWAIAGGWAIDLWLGATTRKHHDVEVAVRRADQALIQRHLRSDWDLECIDPPGGGWRAWRDGDEIALPSFQLKARTEFVEFDIFLESTDEDSWIFRRDCRVTRPLDDVRVITESGMPVVAPEVQLLYMAKSDDPKNQRDFEVARPGLSDQATAWLSTALAAVHPDHQWRASLPEASELPIRGEGV